MGNLTVQSLGYDEFGAWYDDFRRETLEPAAQLAMTLLQRELDDLLSDRDLARINNIAGRVKSKRRTWRKLQRYEVSTVDDIPGVVDDLIGLRITCTNLRDLEMVQAALDSLPRRPRAKRPLALDPTSERDYVDAPKDSGYRGWHVNLVVLFGRTPVTCELQIRTLLQDSWGELTHEDTYSKAGELPPLVEILSKRMADLLATLDDIAEDLRTELDRIDEATVAEPAGVDEPGHDAAISGVAADAADLLLDRWRDLDRPIELASLAWALQKEFGAEVSDDWFGHSSFKRFLRHVIPDGEISTGRQAYLLPAVGDRVEDAVDDTADDTPDDASPTDPPDDAPDAVRDETPDEAQRLRRIDRGFPLVDAAQWPRLYSSLADAWAGIGERPPNTRMLNELTRGARDRAAATGEPVSRRHLDYVAKAVLAGVERGVPLSADRLEQEFIDSTLQRMVDLRILEADDATRRAVVTRWLRS